MRNINIKYYYYYYYLPARTTSVSKTIMFIPNRIINFYSFILFYGKMAQMENTMFIAAEFTNLTC